MMKIFILPTQPNPTTTVRNWEGDGMATGCGCTIARIGAKDTSQKANIYKSN